MQYLTTWVLSFFLFTQVSISVAAAQRISEEQAARDTEIANLRLVDYWAQSVYLTRLDIHLGYVEHDTRPGGGKYLCGASSPEHSQAAGEAIAQALSHLSEATLRKLGLKYVIVCSRLLKGEQSIGGIPVPPLNLLMVVSRMHATDAQGLQALVLHELYHFIEYRFQAVHDADWQRQFGSGYANSFVGRTKVSRIGEGKPGFVNRYAETFPVEDRAELFATLVLEPTTLVAHIEATNDVLLKEKARYLIEKCARLTDLRLAVPGISY